jgi:hypothetical protein
MLPVIARTSNQTRVVDTKRRIRGALLEIRLFNDEPRAVLRALGDALRHNAVYLRLSLVPLAWLAIPLTLLVAHLQPFYGYAGLQIGSPALVTVELREASDRPTNVTLDAPAAVRVDTPAVRLAGANEVVWRIVPRAPGDYVLNIHVGDEVAAKTLHASDRQARRSPRRVSEGIVNQVLYPSELPLADAGPIAAITVSYPETDIDVFGWRVHWVIVYIVLSTAWALLLARRFGVTL